MSIEFYPSIAKIKRNGVYENLPGFVPETGSIATQQMIATAESSATAQYVHNKSEYFRLNDTLYQAIVKINVGDAIVVGTNCEVAVIGNDLTHVANSIAAYELGIATSTHATGEYFMVGETLYVATADIQVGDNISTSTNCRLAVVGDELSGLKTALNKGLDALGFDNRVLIQKLNFMDGYWNTSGVLTPSTTTFHVDKINVTQNHKYYIEFPATTTKIIIRNFNENGTVASSDELTSSGEFTALTNIIAFNGLGTPKVDDIYFLDEETTLAPNEIATSSNVLNPKGIEANRGRYINASGTIGNGSSYAYSYRINVSEGDVVYPVINGSTIGTIRYVTAYSNNAIVTSAGSSTNLNNGYTVPSGIDQIIITIYLSEYDNNNYAVNINKICPYEPYFVNKKVPWENRILFNAITENKNGLIDLTNGVLNKPLSTMPNYILNTLSYKPMPKPSKGYICLVSDDGAEELATYTIPMIVGKNVPLTLAVMSSSEVFNSGDTIKNVVIDAVTNHGCEIAQHGGTNWTEYTENSLNAFFDTQETFFTGLGLSVKSAVIPSHYTTPLIEAVAGGRFGVVRSGYFGHNAQGTGVTIYDYYDYYTSGEFSNLYGLSSFNIKDSLSTNEAAIDYAKANNKVVIMYWHDNDLTTADKTVLESTIDYGKSEGLEFITLSTLKHLIDHERTT